MADNKFYPTEDVLVENGAKRGSAFVDFAGLDYFWSLAKSYVDTADAALAARATELEKTVNGTPNAQTGVLENGLVQKVETLRTEVDALGGVEGGIQGMINKALEDYSTTEQMNAAIESALEDYSTTEQMNAAIKSEADARVEAIGTLTDAVDALSGVVGAPAEGEDKPATGIFKVIEENEKTTTEALTNLDARATALETAKTGLQDQITSMDTAYKVADAALTKAIEDEVARATGAENALANRATALETTVGNETSGLVKQVAALEAKDTELNTTIGTVSEVLAAHKAAKDGEVSIHVTAKDRTAWDGAVTKIETFLKDADMTANAVDTLKELQDYMTSDGAAATELVNRVSTIETTVNGTENNEGGFEGGLVQKVAANAKAIEAAEAAAKSYADGLVTDGEGKSRFDAAGAADKAEAAAKAYTDELYAEITFVTKVQIDGLFA